MEKWSPPPSPKKKLGLLKGWVRVVFVSVCQCPYLTPCFLKLAPACSVDASCAVIPKISCPSFYRTTPSVAGLGCWTFYFLFIYIFNETLPTLSKGCSCVSVMLLSNLPLQLRCVIQRRQQQQQSNIGGFQVRRLRSAHGCLIEVSHLTLACLRTK